MSARISRLIALLGVFAQLGCTSRTPHSPAASATLTWSAESAGVARGILDLHQFVGQPITRLPSTSVVLGRTEAGDGQASFTLVVAGGLRSDGRALVADARDRRVTVFDSTGRRMVAFGRRGGGPGDFEELTRAWWEDDSTIGVFDARLSRMTRFQIDDRVARLIPVTAQVGAGRRLVGVGRNGTVYSVDLVTMIPAESVQIVRPRVALTRDAPGALRDTIAMVAGPESYVGPGFAVGRSFASGALIAEGPGGPVVFEPASGLLSWYDRAGQLTRRLQVIAPRRALDAGLVGRDRRWRIAQVPTYDAAGLPAKMQTLIGNVAASTIQALEELPYPDSLPLFDRILIARNGEVWLRVPVVIGDSTSAWVVLGADGVPNGRFDAPATEDLLGVEGNRMLSVAPDDSGVPVPAVHSLVQGG